MNVELNRSTVYKSHFVYGNRILRVKITLVCTLITLVRVKITFLCRNHTLSCENHTLACKSDTRVEIAFVRV
jgi:hypothetical protein